MPVTKSLLKKWHFAQILYPRLWNPVTKSWRAQSGFLHSIISGIKVDLGWPRTLPLYSLSQIHAKLEKIVVLTVLNKDLSDDTYVLSVKNKDPRVALKLLTAIHEATLAQIRRRQLAHSASIVAVMRKLYGRTENQEIRFMLARILVDQERTNLLLQDPSYPVAVDVISPPTVVTPPHRSLGLWLIAGAFAGVLLAAVMIIILWMRSLTDNSATAPVTMAINAKEG